MMYSVQFSHSVMSDSLWLHGPQHFRPPCPLPAPGVYPNSCWLSWWCHPTISSSVVPLSSCSQSFPASGSFQMSQISALGGQSIGVSASTSVPPMNIQDWSPWGWTGCISLQPRGLSRVFSNTTVQKHQFFGVQLLYSPTLISMDFPCGSAGIESTCNVGYLCLIPRLGRTSGEGKGYPLLFWPGEYHGLFSPWGLKESDLTERLSLSHIHTWLLEKP